MKLGYSYWPAKQTEKSKLLFLHGMGGTGQLWRPIAASLENEYSILAPDQRGHGGSRPIDSNDYTPVAFAQDVIELTQKLSFSPTYVIGHSMGARTACAYAHLNPTQTKGICIIDLGFDGIAGGGLGNNLYKLLKDLPTRFDSRDAAKNYLELNSPDPAISQYLMAVSIADNPKDLSGALSFPFDKDALLKTIENAKGVSLSDWIKEFGEKGLSTLILRGAESKVWSKSEYKSEKAKFNSYSSLLFEEFEGAGHGLPFEKRLLFVERIKKWIHKNAD